MKLIPLFTVLMGFLCLSSCVEIQSDVQVKADGSGTIEDTVLVGAQLKGMLDMIKQNPEAMGQQGAQMGGLLIDEERAKLNAEAYGPGVTVKSLEEINAADGRSGFKTVYAFTDVNQLQYYFGGAQAKEQGDAVKPITFVKRGDKIEVNMPPPGDFEMPTDASIPNAQQLEMQMAMVAPMVKGMRVAAKITLDQGIEKTNATHVNGKSVTLFEVDMDQIVTDPASLKKMISLSEKLKNPNPAQIAEALKDVKGIKVEPQQKIEITQK